MGDVESEIEDEKKSASRVMLLAGVIRASQMMRAGCLLIAAPADLRTCYIIHPSVNDKANSMLSADTCRAE